MNSKSRYLMLKGNSFQAKKRYRKAIQYYEKSAEAMGNDPELLVAWAMALMQLCLYAEARVKINNALALDQTHSIALNISGLLFLVEKQYEKAISAFQKSILNDGRYSPNWLGWAKALKEQGMVSESETVIQEGLANIPDSSDLLTLWGSILSEKGDFINANDKFLLALKSEPNDPANLYNYAYSLYKLKKTGEAKRVIIKAYRVGTNKENTAQLFREILENQGQVGQGRLGKINDLFWGCRIRYKI